MPLLQSETDPADRMATLQAVLRVQLIQVVR